MADRELTFQFRALTDSFKRGVQQATSVLEGMKARVDSLNRTVNAFTSIIAGNVIVQAIERTFGMMSGLVSDAVRNLDTLATEAKYVGLDVASFKAVTIALQEAGFQLEDMRKLMLKADEIVEKLGPRMRAAFGVNVGNLRSGNIISFMQELEKLRYVPMPKLREIFGEKLRQVLLLMQEGFSERVADLIPRARELNEISERVNALEEPLGNLALAWERFKDTVVAALAPKLQEYIAAVTDMLDSISIEDVQQIIAQAEHAIDVIRLVGRLTKTTLVDLAAMAMASVYDFFTGSNSLEQLRQDIAAEQAEIEAWAKQRGEAYRASQQARQTRRQVREAQDQTVATANSIEEWFKQIGDAIYSVVEKVPRIDIAPVIQFMYDIGEVMKTIGDQLFALRSKASLIGGLDEMFRKTLGVGFFTDTERTLNMFQQRMEALNEMKDQFAQNPAMLDALYANVRRDALNALGFADALFDQQEEFWQKVKLAYQNGLINIDEMRRILFKNVMDSGIVQQLTSMEAGVAKSFESFASERMKSQTKFDTMIQILRLIEMNTRAIAAEPTFA
jgi:hypothetical protein